MRPVLWIQNRIPKVFLLSLVIFLLSFLPADSQSLPCKGSLQALAGHPDRFAPLTAGSESSLKGFRGGEREVIQRFDPTVGRLRTADGGRLPPGDSFLPKKESSISQEEEKGIKTIIDDFLVNDDTENSSQEDPAIARDPSGNFIITWGDWRNGNWDIYAQRFDSLGTPLASNFKVNNDTGTSDKRSPAVAADGSGNFIITWGDYRNGNYDIYAQRYNYSGTPLGSNFKVNDDPGNADQESPAIAMDGSGNFVITWEDERNYHANPDIYAQRYDSSGIPLGSNFKVNDNVGHYQSYPAIAMDGSGNFIVTWDSYRDGNYVYDIYAQRYNSSGIPLGSNFRVNDDVGTADQYLPAIAVDGSGNFVITWEDFRNGNYDVYAQRYNSSGNPLDSNFKVNNDPGTTWQWYPAIALDNSGNFVITWEDYRNGNDGDIYAQRYNSSGNPVGSNYLVPNRIYASFTQIRPAVAALDSNIYFTWMDNRRFEDEDYDIYAKMVDWTWEGIICGDVNQDASVNAADVVYLINYLFIGGPAPYPIKAGDVNLDGAVNILDVVYLINYMFIEGPPPCSS